MTKAILQAPAERTGGDIRRLLMIHLATTAVPEDHRTKAKYTMRTSVHIQEPSQRLTQLPFFEQNIYLCWLGVKWIRFG